MHKGTAQFIISNIFKKGIALLLLLIGLLFFFLINPATLYSNKTVLEGLTVYHNSPIEEGLAEAVQRSMLQVTKAEIYNDKLSSQLCLNDGSLYPRLVELVLGSDVFTAFANKVVVLGEDVDRPGYFEMWGSELRFDQFLTHGLLHNLQYRHHGLLGTNPLGDYPNWKWEGYVEYEVTKGQVALREVIRQYDKSDDDYGWVELGHGLSTIALHVKYLAMTKYVIEEKGWTYDQLMKDHIPEGELYEEMISWHEQK